MIKKYRLFNLIGTLLLSFLTWVPNFDHAGAAPTLKVDSCSRIFKEGQNESSFEIPGLHEKSPDNYKQYEQVIERLAVKLVEANRTAFKPGLYNTFRSLKESSIVTVDKVQVKDFRTDYFDFYVILAIQNEGSDRVSFETITMRSNYRVAFLEGTRRFRDMSRDQVKYYKIAYLDGDVVKVADQGEVILNALPDEFSMSRNMSNIERERWIQGQPFYTEGRYGKRVHFAPGGSKFDSRWQPYQIRISKKELLEFYRRGELEINTYEDDENFVPASFCLNFELVFIGDQAIQNLAPYMREQLPAQDFTTRQ